MPSLSERIKTPAKILLIGDSGGGKTGSLAGLANAGFELFIQDYDNGIDPLFTYVKPENYEKVHYITLQDRIIQGPKGPVIPEATALRRGLALLNDWKDNGKSYGSIYSWGPDKILVLDSLTMMGNASLRAEIASRGRTDMFKPKGEKGFADPREVIGDAANTLEALFATLYDTRVKCHVILISHVRNIKDVGYPSAVGQTLPKVLGRYFNTLVGVKKVGVNRAIYTEDAEMATKCPVKVPATLPLSTGLVTIIQAIMAAGTTASELPAEEPAQEGKVA